MTEPVVAESVQRRVAELAEKTLDQLAQMMNGLHELYDHLSALGAFACNHPELDADYQLFIGGANSLRYLVSEIPDAVYELTWR
jgi:hypothetical protein